MERQRLYACGLNSFNQFGSAKRIVPMTSILEAGISPIPFTIRVLWTGFAQTVGEFLAFQRQTNPKRNRLCS